MTSSEVLQIVDSDDEQVVNNANVMEALMLDTIPTSEASPVELESIALDDIDDAYKEIAGTERVDSFELPSDMKELITQISNERVRINFMLELCGMDKIDFSAFSEPELLEAELGKRLQQYREQRKDKAAVLHD